MTREPNPTASRPVARVSRTIARANHCRLRSPAELADGRGGSYVWRKYDRSSERSRRILERRLRGVTFTPPAPRRSRCETVTYFSQHPAPSANVYTTSPSVARLHGLELTSSAGQPLVGEPATPTQRDRCGSSRRRMRIRPTSRAEGARSAGIDRQRHRQTCSKTRVGAQFSAASCCRGLSRRVSYLGRRASRSRSRFCADRDNGIGTIQVLLDRSARFA